MSSPSSKRKSPDQNDATPRKKHRNPTNYVWTPAENRDLMIWTHEFLPQVWSKASVSHANKIKNAIYPNNPLITSENVRHKINNIKAKYRKIRARYDIEQTTNGGSGNNEVISQEVRDCIQSEFSDYFLIDAMIKRSEQEEFASSTVSIQTGASNSSPIYLSPNDDLLDNNTNPDPNSTHPSNNNIHSNANNSTLRTTNPVITAALTDKQALMLKNKELKLEVARLQLQLQTQDSEQRKREIEFTKWKLETEQMVAEMKLMEQKLKLILQQHQQQSEGKPLLNVDNLLPAAAISSRPEAEPPIESPIDPTTKSPSTTESTEKTVEVAPESASKEDRPIDASKAHENDNND